MHHIVLVSKILMSDIIRLLPDSVANQIAAGEVIQRPASVVKELVENAVDAGATSIQIIIRDAGRTLIQVVDNGCGMTDTDARMAFERHATSKIAAATDLFNLSTMGFRGEALASIAAVAQVDLRTMRHDSQIGTRLIINGSAVESQEPEASAPGSNMMVKNLFFNVPARRKFLKKDSVELANIMREFERLALVNPEVEFTLINNDSVMHQLLKGSLKQRIVDLFGKSLEKQIIPIHTETSIVKINGFIGLPSSGRRRNALQYFFVNGRNMRHPYFHKATMSCYEPLIAPDVQPNYFINFEVDPSTIDVNIHPTKNEIKFEDEQAIWQILVAAIKESLGRFNGMPGIDFSTDDASLPLFNPNFEADTQLNLDPGYNPFEQPAEVSDTHPVPPPTGAGRTFRSGDALRQASRDWQRLYEGFSDESSQPASTATVAGSALNSMPSEMLGEESPDIFGDTAVSDIPQRHCISVRGRYIISPSRSGLMVIDQHRAHLRVLFDQFMEMSAEASFATQRMMFPEIVRLSPAQAAVLESLLPEVSAIGFDLSPLGDGDWSLNGAPAVLGDVNPVDTLLRIIEDETDGGDRPADSLRQRLALSMASAAAVRPGKQLSDEEMDHLIASLFSLKTPNYTPDGRLIVSIITIDELASRL